jgi:hypothetical protein
MSVENSLSEVITIYENLKRNRLDSGVSYDNHMFVKHEDIDEVEDEVRSMGSSPAHPVQDGEVSLANQVNRLKGIPADFNRSEFFKPTKYLYFSETTDLLQPSQSDFLAQNFLSLLSRKNYWLNIISPDEQDFYLLLKNYGVHNLTLSDIR